MVLLYTVSGSKYGPFLYCIWVSTWSFYFPHLDLNISSSSPGDFCQRSRHATKVAENSFRGCYFLWCASSATFYLLHSETYDMIVHFFKGNVFREWRFFSHPSLNMNRLGAHDYYNCKTSFLKWEPSRPPPCLQELDRGGFIALTAKEEYQREGEEGAAAAAAAAVSLELRILSSSFSSDGCVVLQCFVFLYHMLKTCMYQHV